MYPVYPVAPGPREATGLRAACAGVVWDVAHWDTVPGDTFLAKCRHVVRGERAPWMLVLTLVTGALVGLLWRTLRSPGRIEDHRHVPSAGP